MSRNLAKLLLVAAISTMVVALLFVGSGAADNGLTPMEELGKELFFDANLSTPPGQSCATCHAPEWGFTGPDPEINATQAVYPGAVHTRAGNRKPPTAAYGGDSPLLHWYDDGEDALWLGGMFWDGRATGWTLGDPLAEQAMGPFLNPLEQNNPNARLVCIKVRDSDYADLFEVVWGPGSLDCVGDVYGTYERIALSISAYEQSVEVNPFSSKFDTFWDNAIDAGLDVTAITVLNYQDYYDLGLENDEVLGLALFNDETKGQCSACHVFDTGAAGYPLFTDFSYDNLGVPKNPMNPFYDMPRQWNPDGADWVDPGLGGFLAGLEDPAHYPPYPGYDPVDDWGKHKVPTLRNVDKRVDGGTKAYAHNGYFKSLEDITHFYNTRDVEPWDPPEVPINVNTDELGDLGLTQEEEGLIVLFMQTLTDN
jgi:cytochrome c peroxidase